MNKTLLNYAFVLLLGALFATILVLIQKPWQVGASIDTGQSYSATTTVDASWPSATAFKTIRTGGGILGSIIVGSSSAAVTAANYSLACYDSSVSTTTASTTLIRLSSLAVAGTYTVDATFNAGLKCDTPVGFNGAYTITWK